MHYASTIHRTIVHVEHHYAIILLSNEYNVYRNFYEGFQPKQK